MSLEQNKSIVRQYWDAFNRGDAESALSVLADDIMFTLSGTTKLSGTFRGKDELFSKLLGPFMQLIEPGAKMTIKELIAEGDTVVCLSEGRMQARTGRPYNNKYAFVFRIRDGKIAEVIEYLDTALIETALFGKNIA